MPTPLLSILRLWRKPRGAQIVDTRTVGEFSGNDICAIRTRHQRNLFNVGALKGRLATMRHRIEQLERELAAAKSGK